MAKFVKVILFLLLAVALHGVAGNVFTEKQVEQPEHAVTYSMKPQGQINAPESPYLPVAELTNLQSHQISVTRIQRVQIGEYFSSLRKEIILRGLSEYKTFSKRCENEEIKLLIEKLSLEI